MNENIRTIEQAITYEKILPLIKLCKAGRLFRSPGMDISWESHQSAGTCPQKSKKEEPSPDCHRCPDFTASCMCCFKAEQPLREPRYSPLAHALSTRRLDLVELLVNHGADIHSVSMDEVFDTWNNDIVEFFINKGADLETGAPLAVALCSRIRTALAIFKRYQYRFQSFQEQVNIALRYHCKEGNLKWVSLMLWAGGDPYAKGPYWPFDADPEDYSSALELAALYEHFDIFKLKAIRLDSNRPTLVSFSEMHVTINNSSLLKMLLEHGFSPRTLEDGGSSLIQSRLCGFRWNFHRWDLTFKKNDNDSSASRERPQNDSLASQARSKVGAEGKRRD